VDVEWMTITKEWTAAGRPGPWTPWSVWHLGIFGGDRWVRWRQIPMVDHVEVDHIGQTCSPYCPPNFEPLGGDPPTSCYHRKVFDDDSEYSIPPLQGTRQTMRVETHDYPWTRTEFESQVENPWAIHHKWNIGSDHVPHIGGGTPSGTRPADLTVMQLPAIIEGERLSFKATSGEYTMLVNRKEWPRRRPLVASRLGVGLHVIEFVGKKPKTGNVHIQIPMTVVSPIEIEVPPVSKITLQPGINGGIVTLGINNRSGSDHATRLEIAVTPVGWMAVPLGDPIRVVPAHEAIEIEIQVERIVVTDLANPPLPFGVSVSLPGANIADVNASFSVIPRDTIRRGRKKPPDPLVLSESPAS
jgi:hypothetical protein